QQDANYDPSKDLEAVQALEEKLGISQRWKDACAEWIATVKCLKEKKFFEALDALELLIVQRILELTKVNRSGTGYKMHKHIAHSLKARSEAVKNAISRYNVAAMTLHEPAPTLSWEEVVEYAFLADFDFLQAT
ncbi:hypothetical protein B0H13DRAFT_1447793, partial [Mycena leptocephala]